MTRPASRGAGVPDDRIARSFQTEELDGIKLTTLMSVFLSTAISLWLVATLPLTDASYYLSYLALFALLAVTHYTLRRRGAGAWVSYANVTLTFAAVTAMFVGSYSSFSRSPAPPQELIHNGLVIFYFVFLTPVALNYSPRLMLWAGVSAALGWGAAIGWVLAQPGTIVGPHRLDMPLAAHRRLHFDPHFVDLNMRSGELIGLLLAGCVLAAVVWRSRRLVISQADAARERTNLARYFPPNIVDELAALDQPLQAVRAQPVAVMFADIVGFTHLAERTPPEGVIALLRQFHERMETAVFDNGGTLDKFLGDGLMATFGTPNAGPRDAANAIACVQSMVTAMAEWNGERAALGQPAIRLSIGIHYGDVVLGDIGSHRRLEFAVLGDVVNVASRLEELTRPLACHAIVSDDVVRVARQEIGAEAEQILAGFRPGTEQALRGRTEPVAIWLH